MRGGMCCFVFVVIFVVIFLFIAIIFLYYFIELGSVR